MTANDEPICGETYDHTLRLIDERDGAATYECTECGAEVYAEPDDEPAPDAFRATALAHGHEIVYEDDEAVLWRA